MKIYILGNPLVDEDNLALKLLPKLRVQFPNIEFKEFEPSEEFPEEPELVLLDTAKGISEPVVLTEKDLNKLETPQAFSLHDFDLAFNLKLMKKLGKLKKLRIIAIPFNLPEHEALEKVRDQIQLILKK